MSKSICIVVLLVAMATALSPPLCKANEVFTPLGCWNSCSDPKFKQCPDFFPAIFNPQFCAYTKEGQYVSQTFECQACQGSNAFAVRNGACTCDIIKCGTDEVCQDGKCVNAGQLVNEVKFDGTYPTNLNDDKGILVKLEPNGRVSLVSSCNDQTSTYKATDNGAISFTQFFGTKKFCQDDKDSIYTTALVNSVRFVEQRGRIKLFSKSGKQTLTLLAVGFTLPPNPPTNPPRCKANEVFTPSGCWNSCSDPKFKQCPDFFPAIFNPQFCAYTKDGQYVSQTFECQACQGSNAFAVRNGACTCDIIKCGTDEVCQDGKCVKIPTDPLRCRKKCPQGQVCFDGVCVRQTPVGGCDTIRCGLGTVCLKGQCVQPQPIDNCAAVTCPFGSTCRNGQCVLQGPVDRCANVRCPRGTTCQNGECVADQRICRNNICQEGYICANNRCILSHQKLEVQCLFDYQCKYGDTCINSRCMQNKCLNVKCFSGSRCDNGRCVPDIQGTIYPSPPPRFGSRQYFGAAPTFAQRPFQPFNHFEVGAFNLPVDGSGPFNKFGQIQPSGRI